MYNTIPVPPRYGTPFPSPLLPPFPSQPLPFLVPLPSPPSFPIFLPSLPKIQLGVWGSPSQVHDRAPATNAFVISEAKGN